MTVAIAMLGTTASAAPARGKGHHARATAQVATSKKAIWLQKNEITGASNGLYGYAVAVSGSTMVVGAPEENEVFVYTGSRTSWTQEAVLTASDGTPSDFFGDSVAITSNSIVVGDEQHGPLTDEGAVYVFSGGGYSWTQQAEFIDPGKAANDFYGANVAASGTSFVAAASGENGNTGAVFVYTNTYMNTWVQKDELTDPPDIANDSFGFGLAVNGNMMVVGAPGTNGFTGAAYAFQQIHGGWVNRATLSPPNGEGCVTTCAAGYGLVGGDYFGYSVAVNYHNRTVAVGSPFASVPPAPDGVGPGTVYVYKGAGGHVTLQQELNPEAPGHNDWFGFNVAVSNNSSVVVNAPYDPAGIATGAAFVFPKQANWSTDSKLVGTDSVPGDYFGWEGLTTISTNEVIVGSPYSPDGGLYFFRN